MAFWLQLGNLGLKSKVEIQELYFTSNLTIYTIFWIKGLWESYIARRLSLILGERELLHCKSMLRHAYEDAFESDAFESDLGIEEWDLFQECQNHVGTNLKDVKIECSFGKYEWIIYYFQNWTIQIWMMDMWDCSLQR